MENSDKQKLLRVYMDILSEEHGSNLTHEEIINLMDRNFDLQIDSDDILVYQQQMIEIDMLDIEQQISNLGLKYD